ncbi:hypothetical protein FNV43_RR25495 [Rhamnella rubrinervis]|uniref:UDP-glucose iridoid glucosyltransferase-like n=1 Tax=Rhamnella rubrinervis TaxID=2594499 RepID=A0A8K0E036_9ROSA|nr:hypothetical protein FNV43_RR25495 [Rhamnella rubrinervis]
MEEKQLQEGKRHGRRLVFVLYPFQGHISPMLGLATILHSAGFSITIVHPQFNSPSPINHPPDFTFISIPDPLSQGKVSPGDFAAAMAALNGDSVADHLKLPAINVRTSAAITFIAFASLPHPQHHGYMSLQELFSQDLGPNLQSLKLKELLEPMTSHIHSNALPDLRAKMREATSSSSAIIVNTLEFLEHEVLEIIKGYFSPPIFTIGPFHKLAQTTFSSTSLLKENTDCISWLDKQAPQSVIYVSFGSMASMDGKEVHEIAWGLGSSQQPFLWVVRSGSVRGSDQPNPLLPEGFEEGVGERGCIVEWAPQKEVLGHSSVGGFWSHCGWNSTLESVCERVPMICRPFFGDQGFNARYVCRAWKAGLELEGTLERDKIEKAVRRLMVDEEGVEMRKKTLEFKVKTQLALKEGGSSYNSLEELVEKILSF